MFASQRHKYSQWRATVGDRVTDIADRICELLVTRAEAVTWGSTASRGDSGVISEVFEQKIG